MTDTKVEVRGIRQLNSALKKMEGDLDKQLRAAFLSIAERVSSDAAGRVPKRTGRAASSIKPKASTRGASIAFGGSRAPYYPWLDFGGRVGIKKSVTRPFIKRGRYVYPAIEDDNQFIRDKTDEALERIARAAGFDTTES